jgi:hypothetical protein
MHRDHHIQVYFFTRRSTNVALFLHALKPMVLLQTTQRVNVALHRAQQIQVYIVTSPTTNAHLFPRALTPMALLQILKCVSVRPFPAVIRDCFVPLPPPPLIQAIPAAVPTRFPSAASLHNALTLTVT